MSIKKILFNSSIKDIKQINDSFSSGQLQVCYIGDNRNGSHITKDAVEKAVPTMYNCPVVCNYDIASDTIGAHDVGVVKTDKGEIKMVNLTDAVGVVPESAEYSWATIVDDGVSHEYFVVEVILWNRSPAFSKISTDGFCAQSMEIDVKEGRLKDNMLYIDDYMYTAFCLLGEGSEPCFESSALSLYNSSDSRLSEQFTNMMVDFKATFQATSAGADNGMTVYTEGGEKELDEKLKLLEKFGLKVEDIDFDLADFTEEEITTKLEEFVATKNTSDPEPDGQFELNKNLRAEVCAAVEKEVVESYWGCEPKYWFYDFDAEAGMVYAHECDTWTLFGMTYTMTGDAVVVNFDSKKRCKLAIVDFVEGDSDPGVGMFERIDKIVETKAAEYSTKVAEMDAQNKEFEAKLTAAEADKETYTKEIDELKEFKLGVEKAQIDLARGEVFEKFKDLDGVEEFEALKEDFDIELDILEEKCFAMLGRKNSGLKFSAQPQTALPKTPIDTYNGLFKKSGEVDKEPYGGLFVKFGNKQ